MFNLKTDPTSLSVPQGLSTRKRISQIQPVNAVVGGAFTGGATVNFKWTNSSSEWWVPSESYLTVRYRLVANDGSIVTGTNAKKVFPAWNGVAGLFRTCQYSMNDVLVSQSNDLAVEDALYKKMNYSREYQKTIGSQYLLDSDADREAMSLRSKVHETNYQPSCLSIFSQNQAIPGTTSHQLSFSIDSNWMTRFIKNDDGANVKTWVVPPGGGAGAIGNEYHLSIEEITFNPTFIQNERVQPDMAYYLDLKEIVAYPSSVVAPSHQHTHTVKPTTYRLSLAFADSKSPVNTGGFVPPTQFKTNVADNAKPITTLQNFRMQYAGQSFPEVPLETRHTTDEFRLSKAYTQSAKSWLLEDNGAGWVSLADFIEEPVLSYSVIRPIDDRSTALEYTMNFSATPTACTAIIFGESLATLQLTYNSVGDVQSVIKMDR